jgi:hypothetical protein
MDLVVLDFRVGLVRNPCRPSTHGLADGQSTSIAPHTPRQEAGKVLSAERELLSELQAAEMKAEVLLEASKADDIEFDELSERLTVEEQACRGAEDACAALRHALENSEEAFLCDADNMARQSRYTEEKQLCEKLKEECNVLQHRSTLEEEQVSAFRKRFVLLEDSEGDPRDASRSAIFLGAEIQSLMQQQELAASTLAASVAKVDPVSLAAIASRIVGLADKTAGKATEAQKLIADSEIRFGFALRSQRECCFNWEALADQRQSRNEQLQLAVRDTFAPMVMTEDLRQC